MQAASLDALAVPRSEHLLIAWSKMTTSSAFGRPKTTVLDDRRLSAGRKTGKV
jgi:hypothetical protein